MNMRSISLIFLVSMSSTAWSMQEQSKSSPDEVKRFEKRYRDEQCDWLSTDYSNGYKRGWHFLKILANACPEHWKRGEECPVADDRSLTITAKSAIVHALDLHKKAESLDCAFLPQVSRMIADFEMIAHEGDEYRNREQRYKAFLEAKTNPKK